MSAHTPSCTENETESHMDLSAYLDAYLDALAVAFHSLKASLSTFWSA